MLFYLPDRRRNPAPKLIRPLSATFGSEDAGRGRLAPASVSEMDGTRSGPGRGSAAISSERSGFSAQMELVIRVNPSVLNFQWPPEAEPLEGEV